MRRCVICGKIIRHNERKVRVMLGHVFSMRKIYFHVPCFFENEEKTKEKMRELAIHKRR